MHTPEDNVAHLNIDYWLEQIKASIAFAVHLLVPLTG
jgi:hypothetical protein